MLSDQTENFSRVAEAESASLSLPEVPSSLGRRLLLFEFLVLLEYWLAPVFLGITNYAGIWSEVGVLLFVPFVGTLIVFVLFPLRPHLRAAFGEPRRRGPFYGIWIVSFVAALFATNSFQVVNPGVNPPGPPIEFGQTTVYSPFGAWPSLTIYVVPLHFYGTFDAELLTVLALISILGAAAVVLGFRRSNAACPVQPLTPPSWRSRLAAVAVWSPFGFITGCSSCAPLYLALIGLAAPSAVAGGYSAVPLVPWIGLAGLLYLFSFWLATSLIHRATRSTAIAGPPNEVLE